MLCGLGQRQPVEGEADGLEHADRSSSRGFNDGSDVGVEFGAPLGSEAVGDLAEDDARARRPLRTVVGRWDRAVGDEHEQVLADLLDDPLELLTGFGRRLDPED